VAKTRRVTVAVKDVKKRIAKSREGGHGVDFKEKEI